MLTNHIYDLAEQLTIESKSLKRIKECYQSDTGNCTECKAFWEKMAPYKEEHIKELQRLLKEHL